jgi:hypothetical protein
VNHEIRAMKNVTISMDEATLRWVRIEAAKAGLSVSKWVADRLQGLNRERAEKAAASARIAKFLDEFPGIPLSENGKINIDRDELYDDGRFRRFDHLDLSTGHGGAEEGEPLRGVAEDPAGD